MSNVIDQYSIDTYYYARNIAQLIRWSATDNVGVCSYDLWAVYAGHEPWAILESSQDTQYTAMAGDYDDDFGGGSDHLDGFRVTARDCTGNATTKAITDRTLMVIQEDGSSATAYAWPQHITYAGAWNDDSCACHLAEHTAFTSERGARASFTRTYEGGDQVAIVMTQGPDRGRASIRLDGRWIMNIDTFAQVETNRVVVFTRRMTAGTHTITIVNHGTRGRPRIELDAILINTDLPYQP